MAAPWDVPNVKANLDTIAHLRSSQHLKTSENGKILERFVTAPKGLLTKAPSLTPVHFHDPIVKVFRKGGELTGWQTVHQNGKAITNFQDKITRDDIKAAFGGLIVLADTYKGSKEREAMMRTLLTDVTKVLRDVGDKYHTIRGGWNDKMIIDGKKGKIVLKLDPQKLEVMLYMGMEALVNNSKLCEEAQKAENQIPNLSEQWIKTVFGNDPKLPYAQMPITGQWYQRQGPGICETGAMDWLRGQFRHPHGTLAKQYAPWGPQFKAINTANPGEVKAIYDSVGKNAALLFAISQLANQASLCAVASDYLLTPMPGAGTTNYENGVVVAIKGESR